MDLQSLCQSISDSSIGTQLRESTYVWPAVEALHVLSLALSVGTIVLVDLRLIGATLRNEPVTDVIEQTLPYSITGFVLAFLSGVILFWSEAGKLYQSYPFRIKLIAIALAGANALWFHSGVFKSVDKWNKDRITPPQARFAGWFGLTFWMVVIFFGRWTAYNLK